ncbi:phage tail protein [Streptomyces flavidovirens]|uniref:Phage tail protein n=1 Tax=Streptomyces flavidovirens TaxID=67298 RepID=A0ABW6RT62_9ACTN
MNEFPLAPYRFQVSIGEDATMVFSKVSGLTIPPDIAAKAGIEVTPSTPESASDPVITFTDGILQDQPELAGWFDPADDSRTGKRDLTIILTDESGESPLATWNVTGAFPTDLSAPNFDAGSNEIAIEEVSLSADSFSLEWH